MEVNNNSLFIESQHLLQEIYGDNANFRDGQYEAIESIFTHRRTLVIEKTGWGKSLIYFISCKMLRKRQKALTLVISPLLVLMDNQKEAAEKLGLNCATLNSQSDKESILEGWINNIYDIIFITPETLFSEKVQNNIDKLKIGMFAIDEVHCISDYGHDFRLQYMRLREIIEKLPMNIPILGVTATANNRVIKDLKDQLGEDIYVLRGPLVRETLNIQVIQLEGMYKRYAWILENINIMPGTGIIYCLTQHDCDELQRYLQENKINVLSYHNGNTKEENEEAIQLFKNNQIKALIATIKLGMGYDKEDISFVIHLQMPANVVSYYQQIGRAGRKISNAYIFLLYSKEDLRILEYFRDKAFPSKQEMETVYNIVKESDGIQEWKIASKCNIRKNRIEKSIMFLENENLIYYDKPYYYSTLKQFEYRENHYEELKKIRTQEINKMIDFTQTTECYNKYLANLLDDDTAQKCGKCSNCKKTDILPIYPYQNKENNAIAFIYNRIHKISPRKLDEERKKLLFINEEGYCLSYYGDYGYGQMVEYDKYQAEQYRNELLKRSVEVIENNIMNKEKIQFITCIPSNRNNKTELLTEEIAKILNLKYIKVLMKKECRQQKEMENTYWQSKNAKENYYIETDIELNNIDAIILVDDIVDSKWTLTWCGYYLMEKGIKTVYPFTLSDSSIRSGINE